MNTRDELGDLGTRTRKQLGLDRYADGELAPGLDGLIDEIVFARVWARPGLSLDDRMIATLSALASVGASTSLRPYVGSAFHLGLSPQLVQEVMIHCAMYSGLATVEVPLTVVADVVRERGLSLPESRLERADLPQLAEAGRATMADLHDARSEDGYASPESAAAELYGTAIQYLYGEIWNRPGITRRQRMICSVAAFTAHRVEAQQRKFFRSAQNVGLTRAEVLEVITQTGPYSGFPTSLNALAVADEVLVD